MQAAAATYVFNQAHGLLATLLINQGRAVARKIVSRIDLQCAPGLVDAYDALARASLLPGQHRHYNILCRRIVELAVTTSFELPSPCHSRGLSWVTTVV